MVYRKFQPIRQWKTLIQDQHFKFSFLIGLLVMFIALIVNIFASLYVSNIEVLAVQDLILDHIPTLDLNFFYVTGITIIISVIFLYPILFRPEVFPFTLKAYASFIIIRSFFISLTHIGMPENFFTHAGPNPDNSLLISFFYKNDLFFSAHTGIPFLAFLLFNKDNKWISYFFLMSSFIMALTVLFMHVHYSIDVFAAYFITYSIYKVTDSIFNKLNFRFRVKIRLLYEQSVKQKKKLLKKLKKVTGYNIGLEE